MNLKCLFIIGTIMSNSTKVVITNTKRQSIRSLSIVNSVNFCKILLTRDNNSHDKEISSQDKCVAKITNECLPMYARNLQFFNRYLQSVIRERDDIVAIG